MSVVYIYLNVQNSNHRLDVLQGDLRDVPLGNCQAAILLGLTAPGEHSRLNGSAAEDVSGSAYVQRSIESGIAAGYQLATASGPLCDEPLWGLAFEVGPPSFHAQP